MKAITSSILLLTLIGGSLKAQNTSYGTGALSFVTAGAYNSAFGYNALMFNTIGGFNTAIGHSSMFYNTEGSYNTAFGYNTLNNNTTGINNVAMGYYSLSGNTTGASNTGIGNWTLASNTTGIYNTSVGRYNCYHNISGNYNTTLGGWAMFHHTSGDNNIALGMFAFANDSTGSNNIVIGYSAGTDIREGSGNVIIGSNMTGLPATLSNTIVLSDGAGNQRMRIDSLGRVGIGSLNPDEKLTVKGTIHAEEVKVDLSVPADYVFQKYYTGQSALKPGYTMPSLAELEQYTKKNNHLPNIPSATEIKENGLNLSEMTNLLLQKVEELTLYTIEQNKKIEALEAKLAEKQ